MTDDERAELIERKYAFLAEREARAQAAAQPADPLNEPPIESRSDRDRRELAERDAAWARARRARARAARAAEVAATPAPPDWSSYVRNALAAERTHMLKLLEAAIVEIETRADRRIADEVRPLRVELAELRVSNARLREQLINNSSGSSAGSVAGISSALN